jgi:hypothetical protein
LLTRSLTHSLRSERKEEEKGRKERGRLGVANPAITCQRKERERNKRKEERKKSH